MQHAVIFVRVSKKKQDYQQQVEDLRAVAQTQAVRVLAEIAEKMSGARHNQDREAIQHLLKLSRRGIIQKILLSKVSHLGCSAVEVLQIAEELTQLGVNIYVQNLGIETLINGEPNSVARLMFTFLAEFARLERETYTERTLSSMDEAWRQSIKIGRPVGTSEGKAVFLKKYAAVVRQLRAGLSVRKTAKLCDVAINTVCKVKRLM